MKKMIIFGASGLLGLNLLFFFRSNYKIFAIKNNKDIKISGINVIDSDFNNNLKNLNNVINSIKPSVIINAIGLTNIDFCEKNHEASYFAHCEIPKKIAQISKETGIKFVSISTDHLSDGKKEYISESHAMLPLNIYGKSKLKGDKEILKCNKDALIIRTSFFGWGPSYRSSLSDYIISNVKKKSEVSLYEDIFFTPIFINNLITLINKLVNKNCEGVYNIGSINKISKYEFGLLLVKRFNLDVNYIKKAKYPQNDLIVRKPLDMSLSVTKIQKDLDTKLSTIENEISDLYNSTNTISYKEIKII